ncbi:MAG: hypothetical protein K8J08_00990, partial [Thermoanaerobaculia bacterium]|nr:hypothetical protein [Thermoanaerobaculia bacterium]
MNDVPDWHDTETDRDDVGELLRLVAPAESVPRLGQARARDATRREWLQVVRAQRRERWFLGSAAAALLLAGLGLV